MMTAASARSGKTGRDENFPVASRLLEQRHRKPILAFYRFARAADDVADHAGLSVAEKLALLDRLETSLLGESAAEVEGVALRGVLSERRLGVRHAQDLLTAFRMDTCKRRYHSWGELMEYCRYSAMPVGRFVLDVHEVKTALWPQSDALCAALQIINHLQDCALDYRNLDRVYLPTDLLAAHGAGVEVLGAKEALPQLQASIAAVCDRVAALLDESRPLSESVRNPRLALEIAVIQRLAERLTGLLRTHDPLSERVHLGIAETAGYAMLGMFRAGSRLLAARPAAAALPPALQPLDGGGNIPPKQPAAASGSSFYAAMRILPAELREAVFEIYSFCHAVDDIADEPGSNRQERLHCLARWRSDIDGLFAEAPARGGLADLAAAIQHFGLRREDFHAVIDGMAMDVTEDIQAPSWETLDLYCDRVACAVGRLCVRVFGIEEEEGAGLAGHLGKALQLTNILRDLDEDASMGRLYLPRETLVKEGIHVTEPEAVLAHPSLGRVCEDVAAVAFAHYAKADALLDTMPRARARAPAIMSAVYRAVLDRLLQRGWERPRDKVRVSRAHIARIVLGTLVR
jgi:phytoene synthase